MLSPSGGMAASSPRHRTSIIGGAPDLDRLLQNLFLTYTWQYQSRDMDLRLLQNLLRDCERLDGEAFGMMSAVAPLDLQLMFSRHCVKQAQVAAQRQHQLAAAGGQQALASSADAWAYAPQKAQQTKRLNAVGFCGLIKELADKCGMIMGVLEEEIMSLWTEVFDILVTKGPPADTKKPVDPSTVEGAARFFYDQDLWTGAWANGGPSVGESFCRRLYEQFLVV